MYKRLITWLTLAILLRIVLKPALKTWNVLSNLSTGQYVIETHLDQLRENVEHLGAMKFAGVALSSLTAISGARIATGSYVGNGVDNRAITGVGFTPKSVDIFGSTISSGTGGHAFRWGTTGDLSEAGDTIFSTPSSNAIQSLDSDGFTVGSANYVNQNAITYYYRCIG